MQNLRTERANSEIERALSDILRTKVNDPRLKQFITITSVKVSVDFRHCKVFVSVYNSNKQEVLKSLKKSEGFIKRELMSMVKLPYTPELTFILDEGVDHSENINKILSTLTIPEIEEDDNGSDETDY